MAARLAGNKRRWLVSAAGGVAVVAAVLLLFRVPPAATPPPPGPVRAPVRLLPPQRDELALRDLAPLFLPTRFNAEPAESPRREPGSGVLDRDRVKLQFDLENPVLNLPKPVEPPASPAAAVRETPGPLAFGMGRTDEKPAAIPPHGALLDVFSAETGKPALDHTAVLGVDARPPVTGRGNLGWQPLEFVAAVDAMGLVGAPSLTRSSGVEEVDDHFRNYLVRVFRLGDRLPPGLYRIVVAP